MLIDFNFFKTIFRELSASAPFNRTPEADLVMNDEVSVLAYEKGGRASGALSGAYLYHLAQMCALIKPGDVVLDLGCGPGNLLAQVAKLNPRAEFIGVDLSDRMLALANVRMRQLEISNVELRLADMTQLREFQNAGFDAVISSMALHHLPDLNALDQTFSEISRVLHPAGSIYLNDFGRLKCRKSVDYFVHRAAEGEEPALVEDYIQSLHAAFSKDEFENVTAHRLQNRAQVFSTAVSPLAIVIKGGKTSAPLIPKRELSMIYRALPKARKSDVQQLKMFLRLGGLRSAL